MVTAPIPSISHALARSSLQVIALVCQIRAAADPERRRRPRLPPRLARIPAGVLRLGVLGLRKCGAVLLVGVGRRKKMNSA